MAYRHDCQRISEKNRLFKSSLTPKNAGSHAVRVAWATPRLGQREKSGLNTVFDEALAFIHKLGHSVLALVSKIVKTVAGVV